MKKAVGIAAGVIVVVGALATAGAWYTGTQLEGVLKTGVANANEQFDLGMVGADGRALMHLELVSLDRQLFSSTAHYRLQVRGQELGDESGETEFLLVDHIEHGPFPASRLKALALLPVMATSNVTLEASPSSAPWFAAAKGEMPLRSHVSVHYGGDAAGTVSFAPLEMKSARGSFSFSGLQTDLKVGANAEHYGMTGKMTALQMNLLDRDDNPSQFVLKDVSFNLGGTRGESGFYLGHNDAKLGNVRVQVPGSPPVELQGMVTTSLAQEVQGMLGGEMSYGIDAITMGDKPLGQLRSTFKFGQFDSQASKSLYRLFQTKIAPQQRAAAAAGIPFRLQLSEADQKTMNADATKLLAGKPHLELQNLSLKTANGAGAISFSLDLTPVPLSGSAVAPAFGANAIGAIDAKVALDKSMLNDLGVAQAQLQGATDPAVIALNGKNVSDMVSGMAVMMQLGKVENDTVTSELHYAAGMVDFNGQRMTAPQFLGSVLGRIGIAPR